MIAHYDDPDEFVIRDVHSCCWLARICLGEDRTVELRLNVAPNTPAVLYRLQVRQLAMVLKAMADEIDHDEHEQRAAAYREERAAIDARKAVRLEARQAREAARAATREARQATRAAKTRPTDDAG